jgi:hypothetical protein
MHSSRASHRHRASEIPTRSTSYANDTSTPLAKTFAGAGVRPSMNRSRRRHPGHSLPRSLARLGGWPRPGRGPEQGGDGVRQRWLGLDAHRSARRSATPDDEESVGSIRRDDGVAIGDTVDELEAGWIASSHCHVWQPRAPQLRSGWASSSSDTSSSPTMSQRWIAASLRA